MYTHGSSTFPAFLEYCYAIYKDTGLIASGGKFLPGEDIYDAEIIGTVRGLEVVLEMGDSSGIKLLRDNQEAVEALESGRTNPSLFEVKTFKELCSTHSAVEVHWIPRHKGMHGNGKSDTLVKKGTGIKNRGTKHICDRKSPRLRHSSDKLQSARKS